MNKKVSLAMALQNEFTKSIIMACVMQASKKVKLEQSTQKSQLRHIPVMNSFKVALLVQFIALQ